MGEKGWGNIGLGGSAVFLHSVCAWVSKRISTQTSKTLGPNHKKASYGAMLGTMCGMHGGKMVGETLA